jgi:MoxR-like ATPase
MGASPRGTIALLKMAKAMAILENRDYVTAEDVQNVLLDTLGHRVKLGQRARAQGMNLETAMTQLLTTVRPPRN